MMPVNLKTSISAVLMKLAAGCLANAVLLLLIGQTESLGLELTHPKYQFQDRKNSNGLIDRREGLKAVDIGGERLALISTSLTVRQLNHNLDRAYRAGFILDKTEAQLNLKIRDIDAFNGRYNYWMVPHQKAYDRGFHQFVWSDSLPRELGLTVKDLAGLALAGGHGHNVVSPVLLSDAPFPARLDVLSCCFLFVPSETMHVEYRIFPLGNKQGVVLTNQEEKWNKDQSQLVCWEGRDLGGETVPDGRYVLSLTAEVTRWDGLKDTIYFDCEFFFAQAISCEPQKGN